MSNAMNLPPLAAVAVAVAAVVVAFVAAVLAFVAVLGNAVDAADLAVAAGTDCTDERGVGRGYLD